MWELITTSTGRLGEVTAKTNRVQELATGKRYFDGTDWKPSEANFIEAPDEFEADKVQHRVHLKRDLNVGGAVFVTTPDQQQIYATPIAIGLYSPENGQSHSWEKSRTAPERSCQQHCGL